MVDSIATCCDLLRHYKNQRLIISAGKNRTANRYYKSTDFLRLTMDCTNKELWGYPNRLCSSLIYKKPWQREKLTYDVDANEFANQDNYMSWLQYQRRLKTPFPFVRAMMLLDRLTTVRNCSYDMVCKLMSDCSFGNGIYEPRLRRTYNSIHVKTVTHDVPKTMAISKDKALKNVQHYLAMYQTYKKKDLSSIASKLGS